MKLTKKLIPALGMLVLSACMLVTSTFAWFSMNDEVTASGMTVKAVGEQIYLQIVTGDKDFAKNSAQTSATASASGDLKPISVFKSCSEAGAVVPFENGKNIAWATNVSDNDSNKGPASATGYLKKDNTEGYALLQTFKLRLDPDAGATTASGALKVKSVSLVDDNGTELAHAVSVLVVLDDNAQWFKQGADGQSVAGDGTVSGWTPAGDTALTDDKFTNGTGGYVTVSVYVFFDGEHEDCTTKNFWDAEKESKNSYSVQLSFTCAA